MPPAPAPPAASDADDSPQEALPRRRGGRSSGRVTLADVAHAAGVSPITVSRALRGERSVGAELVARVEAAAARLGYVPDAAARALASSSSRHVAVLVPLLTNALFIDLLDAAQHTLRAAGYQVLIGITRYDADEELRLLQELLAHRPAGLLVAAENHRAETLAMLDGCGRPWVRLMELDGPGHPVASVGFSQREAAAALTRHLVGRGHRRIAFAAAQLDRRVGQRMQGWRDAMAEAGLATDGLVLEDARPSSMALGAEMLRRLRSANDPIDAIFFCNDDLAQGAFLAASRAGVRVPQDLAIAGFNDLPGSDEAALSLTTVATPRRAIGRLAAERLLEAIAGGSDASAQALGACAVPVPWSLQVRDSG